jgi:hypothetical protein
MARSSGSSKVPVLVHPVFIYRPNSPLKRRLNYFSDSFPKGGAEPKGCSSV